MILGQDEGLDPGGGPRGGWLDVATIAAAGIVGGVATLGMEAAGAIKAAITGTQSTPDVVADPGSVAAGVDASPAGSRGRVRGAGVTATEVAPDYPTDTQTGASVWPWLLGLGLVSVAGYVVYEMTKKRRR